MTGKAIVDIPLARITVNPEQPRKVIRQKQLDDLIASIREHGILLPLLVSEEKGGRFQLIAGERRFRAAEALGLTTVPAVIKRLKERDKLEIALIENIQRQSLNSIEEAEAYAKLQEQFGLSQEAIAKRLGKKRSTIANTLRLLHLPENIKRALFEEKLTAGHAKVLLSVSHSPQKQYKLFQTLLRNNWSVSETEQQKRQQAKKRNTLPDAQLSAWRNDLENVLSTRVAIKKKRNGGRIIIEYYSLEELKHIVDCIVKRMW